MTKISSYIIGLSLIILSAALPTFAQTGTFGSRDRILKSVSAKKMVETARDHQWSLDFTKRGADTVHVVAIRVDFVPDKSTLTTGNGKFGGTAGSKEDDYYWRDTVYRFDKLDHDSLYFAHQLTGLHNYYKKVSRGKLTIEYSIYPKDGGQVGYTVPDSMSAYSPGWKKKNETTNEYWDRKTYGLMKFVRDAIETADRSGDSPFANLYTDDNGTLRVKGTDHKAAILIIHAGASYLTDGGLDGAVAADSPSDMIDAFIDPEFFKYFRDTLKLDTAGVKVNGKSMTIDEVMMCAETSNQDGLNWGIQGVLVNQMARQLGIPDLFSTSSGISAIGAFCIMDFAGYSAAQGFIPPYPSAWVRAFMGWDTPRVAGAGSPYRVKALTSALDNQDGSQSSESDTTILLIPINNNEYYLVENRQRNLTGEDALFRYDLQDEPGVINPYPFNVNIAANVAESCGTARNVIVKAKNNDISLPASGVLVWHVDERVIRNKLAYNFVNADSSYRGIRLVEADGINDLGVTFTDAFYQAAFDYGGAEDVFPHRTRAWRDKPEVSVFGFGPYTSPSTRSNDGGHTGLNIDIRYASAAPRKELAQNFQERIVENFADEFFTVTVTKDYTAPGWPRRAAPERMFHDPLVTEIATSSSSPNTKDTVLAVLGESGRLYLHSVNRQEVFGAIKIPVSIVGYDNKQIETNDTIKCFDTIPGAFTFPTAIDGKIYVPDSARRVIHVYPSADINDKTAIAMPDNTVRPTSYVCGIAAQTWVMGLSDGRVMMKSSESDPVILGTIGNSNTPVRAIAALKDKDNAAAGSYTVIQDDGTLTVKSISQQTTISTTVKNGIAPFSLVTGDLDKDGTDEIIVSDSRQGIWVYKRNNDKLELAQGWKENPNDWANTYYIDPENKKGVRARYPQNYSAPALADLNRDGMLDIIISGTNGVYALNRKGALLSRWPAYQDTRYWYQRGSITTAPVVAGSLGQPLVLFSSPTGERSTFDVTKIVSAHPSNTGKDWTVTFRRSDGSLDSLWDLSKATIDTILTMGDSLIYPYTLPGGYIDALTPLASRPMELIPGRSVQQSRWPLSTGAPAASSPLIYRKANGQAPDVFAVSSDGTIHKWRLDGMVTDSLYWPQNGFDAARSFAYGGRMTTQEEIAANPKEPPITFWNYPNPTIKGDRYATFKYKFNGKATNVRLDIYTITGKRMDSFTMKDGLTGDYPDWNEFGKVNLRKYGPGVYRCRMGATINGKKYSKFWKMAVVK